MTRPANLFRMTPEIKAAIGRHPAAAPQPTEQAVRGTGAGRPPAASGKTAVGKTTRLRCSTCQHESPHVATIERHCHAARHLRYEWLWR